MKVHSANQVKQERQVNSNNHREHCKDNHACLHKLGNMECLASVFGGPKKTFDMNLSE